MSAPAAAPARPPSWPMLRAMVGIGLVCGVLIVATYQATEPVIARNRAAALRAAIFQVLPAATASQTFLWTNDGAFAALEGQPPAGAELVYAGYDDSGKLAGLAIEGDGMGYQDTITLLWGYSSESQTTVGIQVLESKETPGLGDKIMTDEGFRQNFDALDLSLDASGAKLANTVVAVKHGEKTNPWQVDGITGATISSVAIAKLVDESASRWLPRIRRNLEAFQNRGTAERTSSRTRLWIAFPTTEARSSERAFRAKGASHGD